MRFHSPFTRRARAAARRLRNRLDSSEGVPGRVTSMKLDTGNWRAVVTRYQQPDVRRAVTQMVTTLVPLAAMMYLMYLSLAWSYWLTLALAVPTAGFLVRTFIIMHDCGHGSFLPSQKWNNVVGWVTGVLTATPYSEWRHEHAIHHATAGDLDRRGHGDIATLTVDEYLARGPWGRLRYRLYRNPLTLLAVGPLYTHVRASGFRDGSGRAGLRRPGASGPPISASRCSSPCSRWSSACSRCSSSTSPWAISPPAPASTCSSCSTSSTTRTGSATRTGTTRRRPSWAAPISSCLWCCGGSPGNIGLHHVHHLAPRIPNYNLQRAHDENPIFHQAPTISLAQSVKMLRLALWDEQRQRMVGFCRSAVAAARLRPGHGAAGVRPGSDPSRLFYRRQSRRSP